MSLLKRWIVRTRSRARTWGLRARLTAVAAAVLVAVGGVWLVVELADGEPVWAPVTPEAMDAADVAAAVSLAEKRHLAHRLESGRLLIPADMVEEFRGLLTYEGLLTARKVLDFEALADESDIWRSPTQSAKRWQAAKMSALSRLIGHFPGVRQATVLLEPGMPRGLGRAAVPPTAAVHAELAADARMSPRLVAAIADLVAGSVAGMDRQDVRIVAAGQSHRVGSDLSAADHDPVERLRQAEAFYQAKVEAALRYMRGAAVGVSVTFEDGADRCRSACVNVPRGYLASAYRASRPGAAEPDDEALESFACERLAKVRESVMHITGVRDANAVKVDWYYDVAAAGPVVAAAAGPPATGPMGDAARGAAAASLTLLGLLSGSAAAVRRCAARRRAGGDQDGSASAAAQNHAGAPGDEDPLAALQRMAGEELRALLQGEHPQTLALVLSHAEPAVGAAVLASLARPQQVEVSRRIAEMAAVDSQVVAEIVRGLRSRRSVEGAVTDEAGGVGKVAQILHHAGYATEKAVLDGLTGAMPSLADSIRRQLFVFEDVAALPRGVLRSALESLGSDELAIALRTAGKEVKEKVLSSLSREAAAKVRDEMERIGPVRLSDVEAAQDRVVAAVRRLEAGRYVSTGLRKGSEVLA